LEYVQDASYGADADAEAVLSRVEEFVGVK
jgi:hypothetical protein